MYRASAGEGHWGLRPGVAFRVELDTAFVDDGQRLYRVEPSVMYRVTDPVGDAPAPLEVEAQLERLPSVFARYLTRDLALESLVEET